MLLACFEEPAAALAPLTEKGTRRSRGGGTRSQRIERPSLGLFVEFSWSLGLGQLESRDCGIAKGLFRLFPADKCCKSPAKHTLLPPKKRNFSVATTAGGAVRVRPEHCPGDVRVPGRRGSPRSNAKAQRSNALNIYIYIYICMCVRGSMCVCVCVCVCFPLFLKEN